MNVESISRDLWLLRTFRNGARFVLGFRTGTFPTEAVFLDGYSLKHPPGLTGLTETVLEILHDRVYTPSWFYTPRPNDTIIDLGANIGVFAISEARRNSTARIVCLEPHPEIYRQLAANVLPYGGRIKTINAAAQSTEGAVTMSQPSSRSLDMRAIPANDRQVDGPTVAALDLSQIVNQADDEEIAILKCDIEGAEADLFEGVNHNDLMRIRHLAIEYHDNIVPCSSQRLWQSLYTTHRMMHLVDSSGCGIMLWKRRDLVGG